MTALQPLDRTDAWNIWIVDPPSSKEDSVITGVFQSIQSPFLSWRDLFEDLLLCFDLESAVTSPLGQLTLWNRNEDEPLFNNRTAICFSTDESDSDKLSAFIPVGDSTGDKLTSKLILSVVLHDLLRCTCTQSCLALHLRSGCATPLELARNPRFFFFPISSMASSSSRVTPQEFDQTPPAKRSYNSLNSSPQELSPRNMCQNSPTSRLTTPINLDSTVKHNYNGTCTICGNNTSWGKMVSGPGLKCAHIFPKALFELYNYPNTSPRQDKWSDVNSPSNCVLMDSLCHRLHDNRLLAIHPVTHRVRLFAPISPLIKRNHAKAFLPNMLLPSESSLKWHYEATVAENMWTLFMVRDGGSRRYAWLGGPRPVLMKELDGFMKNQRNTFKNLPGPSKLGGADRSGVTEGSAQEGTDCVVDAFHNESLQCTSYLRKQSLSFSSADVDVQTQHNFSTILVELLEEEARSQATLEKMQQWANCQWEEVNVDYQQQLLACNTHFGFC